MNKIKVTLLNWTPLDICSTAIRTCWNSFDKSDNGGEKDKELIYRVGNKYKHSCYDNKTECLTDNGWKLIRNVMLNDKVLTFNPDKKEMELKQVKNKFEYVVDTELLHFKTAQLDLMVTDNHKIYANRRTTKKGRSKDKNFKLVEAKELEKVNHQHLKTGKYDKKNSIYNYDEDFCKLIGFFIGGGHYKNKGNNISFHTIKKRKISYLKKICKAKICKSNQIFVEIKDRKLFNDCYNEDRKKIIPLDLFKCSFKQLLALLDGLINSDEYLDIRNNKNFTYSSSSIDLLNQIQTLGILLGYSVNIAEYSSKGGVKNISFSKKRITPEINRASKTDIYRFVKRIKYIGKVYCLEVDNHIFMTRRNGICVFSGNSTLEHLYMNFYIKGISRLLLQELARHRIASLSVKSSRYTLKELKNIDIDNIISSKYLVQTDNVEVNNFSLIALKNLIKLIKSGVSNDIAKYSMPESFRTELTWSINVRSLQNFLELRSSKSALLEIQLLSKKIFEALPKEYKYLFI